MSNPNHLSRRELLRGLLAGAAVPLLPPVAGMAALLPHPTITEAAAGATSALPIPAPVLLSYRDADNLFLMRLMLEMFGIRTAGAPTGPQVLEYCRTQPVTMILTDLLKIGGLAGDDLVRQLREDPTTRDLPILFIDTAGHADAILRGLEAGANDYITLPMLPFDLVGRIGRYLPLRDLYPQFTGQRILNRDVLRENSARLRAERDQTLRRITLPSGTVVSTYA